MDGLPVIVASSLSGLLISLSLARSGIRHVLIGGDEPQDVPRLGESLNENASLDLLHHFGADLRQFFFPKSHISLLDGDFATLIHLANPRRDLGDLFRNTPDGQPTRILKPYLPAMLSLGISQALAHVDRIGFDKAIYHKVRAQSCCQFVKAQVRQIHFDRLEDRVSCLELDDGTVIDRPSFVFDATGPRGLVAEAAQVGKKFISNEQRVVWTHYRQPQEAGPEVWWRKGTNLLRTHEAADGIEGISWMIPLGGTLSVGVSVDADRYGCEHLDSQDVLRRLAAAYTRRGIDYRMDFPEEAEIQEIKKHRYFVRERAYGGNWLLVGGTFIQIWFPSSAGLWSSTAVSAIAADIIKDPARLGAYYESIMRPLTKFHDLIESMVHGPVFESQNDAYHFWIRWLGTVPGRLAQYFLIADEDMRARWWERTLLTYFSRASVRFNAVRFPSSCALISCRKPPDMAQQAASFPKYFQWSPASYLPRFVKALRFMFPAGFVASRRMNPTTQLPPQDDGSHTVAGQHASGRPSTPANGVLG